MSEAFSLRDHLFNAATLGQLAEEFAVGVPGFDAERFLATVLPQLPELGLLRLQLASQMGSKVRAGEAAPSATAGVDFKALLKTYEDVQAKHHSLHMQQKKAEAKGVKK